MLLLKRHLREFSVHLYFRGRNLHFRLYLWCIGGKNWRWLSVDDLCTIIGMALYSSFFAPACMIILVLLYYNNLFSLFFSVLTPFRSVSSSRLCGQVSCPSNHGHPALTSSTSPLNTTTLLYKMSSSESSWRRHRPGTQTGGPSAFRRNLCQASSASRTRQNAFPRQFQSPRPSTRAGSQISPSTPAPASVCPGTAGAQLPGQASAPIQQEELEPDDDLCHVVMALDVKERGTVGCCYYVAEEQRLYILEDVAQGGLDIIETRMLHSTVLTKRSC